MRVLGIDYGHKRLGLALSDEGETLASPLPVYRRRDTTEDHAFLAQLVEEREVSQIVVGLPRNMDGSLGEMAKQVLAFVETLRKKTHLPVGTFDERLTSAEAERVLIQADLSRKRRKTLKDSLAAVLILQGSLDSVKNA
jgi:putative Holliday junction resolvase